MVPLISASISMPEIYIVKYLEDAAGSFEENTFVLMQRRGNVRNSPYCWTVPGGHASAAERELIRTQVWGDKSTTVELNKWGIRRCAIRELVEEAGSGRDVGESNRGFRIHGGPIVIPAVGQNQPDDGEISFRKVYIPPGLRSKAQREASLPVFTSHNCCLYVLDDADIRGIDYGWGFAWHPKADAAHRAEIDESYSHDGAFEGYAWVALSRIFHVASAPKHTPLFEGHSKPIVSFVHRFFRSERNKLVSVIQSELAKNKIPRVVTTISNGFVSTTSTSVSTLASTFESLTLQQQRDPIKIRKVVYWMCVGRDQNVYCNTEVDPSLSSEEKCR